MFESFTDSARWTIAEAESQARSLLHNYVGTEHILLGLTTQEGMAARALAAMHVDAERVRAVVRDIIGAGSQEPAGNIPFTPRAKKVFELARREALQLGHDRVDTEHLLLGLIREGEGVGAQVMVQLGAGLNETRRQVILMCSGAAPVPSGGRPDQLLEELRGIFAENDRLHRENARLTEILRTNGIAPD